MKARLYTGLISIMSSIACATGPVAAASPADRREELAKVQELINDPDPLMRLANFEALAEEGDAAKVQIAIQTALTGGDAMLRAAAMKAYLAGGRQIAAKFSLDPVIQQKLDKAMPEGEQAVHATTKNYSGLGHFISITALSMSFQVLEFDSKSSKGRFTTNWSNDGDKGASLQISGDRIVGSFGIRSTVNAGACPFEMRPTRDLMLVGSFTCSGTGFGVVKIVAPMF